VTSLIPSPERVGAAAANVVDGVFRGGLADLRRTPAQIIDEAPQRTIYRYLHHEDRPQKHLPVLLVPPLAAPTLCFDLRRGCSLAEHLLAEGHPTYLLEYGDIAFSDKDLGLEHWVHDVVPTAIQRVSEDNGGAPVQLVGWCLGGIMSLLAVAADGELPVNSIAMVASPFDFQKVRLMGPIRGVANVTNGMLGTALYRALGGAPAPLTRWGFQLTSIDKYLTKPIAKLQHLHDREWLAHVEAVDHFMANMHAYPGRTLGQLYHQFFRVNEMAGGTLDLGDHVIELANIHVPVMNIAGTTDVLAPKPAVFAVADLLPHAPDVRLETAPGGHLGVLTGRSARKTTWAFVDDFLDEHAGVGQRRRALRVVA
jgi:polyhydroxyalkanoate synthase